MALFRENVLGGTEFQRYGIPVVRNSKWRQLLDTVGVEHKLITVKQLAIFRVHKTATLKMANPL